MSDDANIVPFKARSSDLSEEYRRAYYSDKLGRCDHKATKIVDEKERTVECEKCKAVLDPVMCLLNIATEWGIYHGPRLKAIREYMTARKKHDEDFNAWWVRVGRGREYRTKKDAAEQAFWAASTPDLKLCAEIIKGEDADKTGGA